MNKLKTYYDNLNDTAYKLKFILYLTWVWAMIGIYTVKIIEFIFKCIIYIPNSLLNPIESMMNTIETTEGDIVNIIFATDSYGNDIKNKLKLFIDFYYEKASDATAHETNGVNIKKLFDYVNDKKINLTFTRGVKEIISYLLVYNSDDNKISLEDLGRNMVTNLFLHHFTFDNIPDDESSSSDSDLFTEEFLHTERDPNIIEFSNTTVYQ